MDENTIGATGVLPYSLPDEEVRRWKREIRRRAWMVFVNDVAEKDLSAIWVVQGVESTSEDYRGENYYYYLRVSRAQTHQVTIALPPPMSALSSMALCRSETDEIAHRVKRWLKNVWRKPPEAKS